MSQYVIGRNNIALAYNGKLMGRVNYELDPGMFRFEFSDPDVDPRVTMDFWGDPSWGYWVKVPGVQTNQWDLMYLGKTLEALFHDPYTGGLLIPDRMNGGTCKLIDAGDISGFWSSESQGVKTNSLRAMFDGCTALTEVNAVFDLSNTNNIRAMFYGCTSLRRVPTMYYFHVEYMQSFCEGCTSLEYVPLLNTQNVIDMSWAFRNCTNIISGAYALYNQASTQQTPPNLHIGTFYNCGSNTTTGAQELSQIPENWKQSSY